MADTDEKQSPDRLLPWYLNKTLSAEEQAKVTVFLDTGGKEAEAELDLLQKVAEQASQNKSVPSPGELGWKRLQRQIHAEKKQNTPVQLKQNAPIWYKPALAAALAIIVVQGSFLLNYKDGPEGDIYQPLSTNQMQVPLLQVKFSPAATEQQIRKILRAAQVNLVDGPSTAGIYRLQTTSTIPNAIQFAEKELRSHHDIIIHVTAE